MVVKKTDEEKALSWAVSRDTTLTKKGGYTITYCQDWLYTLLKTGSVTVGYRMTCQKTDFTVIISRAWYSLVRHMEKNGYVITKRLGEPSKYGSNEGYWSEYIYTLKGGK